jgi:serine/threonine-protein kinase
MSMTPDYALALGRVYKVERQLGKGQFGSAWYGVNKLTGERVVLKLLKKDTGAAHAKPGSRQQTSFAGLQNEVQILQQLKPVCGKHIVCYEGFFETPREWAVATKFIPDALPLSDLFGPKKMLIPVSIVGKMIDNLIIGLRTIHQQGVAHRDIKPPNILVNVHTGAAWFIDFGIACTGDRCSKNLPLSGTPGYIPYDIMLRERPGGGARTLIDYQRGDIWSLGIVIWGMLNGVTPYYSFLEHLENLRTLGFTVPKGGPGPQNLPPGNARAGHEAFVLHFDFLNSYDMLAHLNVKAQKRLLESKSTQLRHLGQLLNRNAQQRRL